MAKWAVELSEYNIEYKNRTCAKSQVLVDFLIELTPELETSIPNPKAACTLYVDGSSSRHGSGIGIRLESPTKEVLEQSFRLAFLASNNEAEYGALIAGLRLAKAIVAKRIDAFCDSQLVAMQFSGDYEAKNDRMDAYLKVVQELAEGFANFTLTKIPRGDNTSADALAALASSSDPMQKCIIPVESIEEPSIDITPSLNLINEQIAIENDKDKEAEEEPLEEDEQHVDWRTEILLYNEDGELLEDKWVARRLKTRCANYVHLDGNLYRRSPTGAWLSCIDGAEIDNVIRETHEGAGGNHSGGRSLTLKIKKLGFYWPAMEADCQKHATRCEKCQRHAPMIHAPTKLLKATAPPYPFMRWAMDIVGPLPRPRQQRYILVITDYFTKWVEDEAYPSIKDEQVRKFVWKNIICRHGLPYEIVTDNGSQFISNDFEDFCASWSIRLSKSTPQFPQGNGQAEATNKKIIDGLKKRLEAKKGLWADELDGVLWSHRTTPRRATGRTPFSLCHGVEAMAPAEAAVTSVRRMIMPEDEKLNNERLCDHNDLTEEDRDQSLVRIQNYQHQADKYYRKKVKERRFEEGDLVLRKAFENKEELKAGKPGANWEGPYLISKIVKPGVYQVMEMDGTAVPRSWNVVILKNYYY